MSLTITKAGILDSVQDLGRWGYRSLGINPTGAMDHFSLMLANMLVGNEKDEACLEMFFPAATIRFEEDTLIAITGADMDPTVSGQPVPVSQPFWIRKGSLLHFDHLKSGYCCYLSVKGGFDINPWLGSRSTHIRAGIGGWEGRALQTGDQVPFRQYYSTPFIWKQDHIHPLPFGAAPVRDPEPEGILLVTRGPEWEQLSGDSKNQLEESVFTITVPSDRMGFRLRGEETLKRVTDQELVSSTVDFGTLQLLPNGQAIILLADHQTTGGYPRIGRVIKAHHHRLVQHKPGEHIRFKWVDHAEALRLCINQARYLKHLEIATILKLEEHCTHEPIHPNQRNLSIDH